MELFKKSNKIHGTKENVNLIFTDIQMPFIDGYDLSKEINVLSVLYGDKSNAEGLKSTFILTKNLASSASKHSANEKLTQD